jgi:hypothetical protein
MLSHADVRALDLAAGESKLLEEIMSVETIPARVPGRLRATLRHRRKLALGVVVGSVLMSGTAYAVVSGLSSDRAAVVEHVNPCGITADTGVRVASTKDSGQLIEYWTFDGPDRYADWLFVDNAVGGGGGCGIVPRSQAHPTLPWAEYLLDTGSDQNTYTVFGQAPPGAVRMKLTFNVGTVEADVAPNGYYVARAKLPTAAIDELQRVEAMFDSGKVVVGTTP